MFLTKNAYRHGLFFKLLLVSWSLSVGHFSSSMLAGLPPSLTDGLKGGGKDGKKKKKKKKGRQGKVSKKRSTTRKKEKTNKALWIRWPERMLKEKKDAEERHGKGKHRNGKLSMKRSSSRKRMHMNLQYQRTPAQWASFWAERARVKERARAKEKDRHRPLWAHVELSQIM